MTSPRRFSSPFPVSRALTRLTVLVAVIAVMLAPSMVHAQDYPPAPTLLADPAIAPQGTIVTLSGSGFLPGATIEIYLVGGPLPVSSPVGQVPVASFAVIESASPAETSPVPPAADLIQSPTGTTLGTLLGTTTSDAAGSFTFQWNTAGYAPGRYTIAATDGTNTSFTDVVITTADEPAVVTPVRPAAGAAPTTGRALPQTGGIGDDLVRMGVVLLTIGGMAILASRGRWRRLLPTR